MDSVTRRAFPQAMGSAADALHAVHKHRDSVQSGKLNRHSYFHGSLRSFVHASSSEQLAIIQSELSWPLNEFCLQNHKESHLVNMYIGLLIDDV